MIITSKSGLYYWNIFDFSSEKRKQARKKIAKKKRFKQQCKLFTTHNSRPQRWQLNDSVGVEYNTVIFGRMGLRREETFRLLKNVYAVLPWQHVTCTALLARDSLTDGFTNGENKVQVSNQRHLPAARVLEFHQIRTSVRILHHYNFVAK
jgi:hypothetical protein